jgi:hypothetical protein
VEVLRIFEVLSRHRIMVAVGLLVSVLAGIALASRSPGQATTLRGVAGVRVLLDETGSLVVDASRQGTRTIGTRAALLADLMAADDGKAAVAKAAGVPRDRLTIVTPSMGSPVSNTPLPERATLAASAVGGIQPYVLMVRPEGQMPILEITARAPDERAAGRLANAATAGLHELIAARTVAGSKDLTAQQLGQTRVIGVANASSHRRLIPLIATIALFLAWCSGIVVASGLLRAWPRTTRAPRTS